MKIPGQGDLMRSQLEESISRWFVMGHSRRNDTMHPARLSSSARAGVRTQCVQPRMGRNNLAGGVSHRKSRISNEAPAVAAYPATLLHSAMPPRRGIREAEEYETEKKFSVAQRAKRRGNLAAIDDPYNSQDCDCRKGNS
jgi:hypothetical protein